MNAEIIYRLEQSFVGGPLVGAEGWYLMEERMKERQAELLSAVSHLRTMLSLWGGTQADNPSKEDKS